MDTSNQNNIQGKKIGRWTFFIFYSLYIIISFIIFSITGGGWAGLINLLIGLLVVPITIIHILVPVIKRKHQEEKSAIINYRYLYLLLLFQAIAILFNFGDCGDCESGARGGSFNYFEVLLEKAGILSMGSDPLLGDSLGIILSLITKLMYLIFLAKFFRSVFDKDKTPTENSSENVTIS